MPKYIAAKCLETSDMKCVNLDTKTITINNIPFSEETISNLAELGKHNKNYYLTGDENGIMREEFEDIKEILKANTIAIDSINNDIKNMIELTLMESKKIERINTLVLTCQDVIAEIEKKIPVNMTKVIYLMGLKIHKLTEEIDKLKNAK